MGPHNRDAKIILNVNPFGIHYYKGKSYKFTGATEVTITKKKGDKATVVKNEGDLSDWDDTCVVNIKNIERRTKGGFTTLKIKADPRYPGQLKKITTSIVHASMKYKVRCFESVVQEWYGIKMTHLRRQIRQRLIVMERMAN